MDMQIKPLSLGEQLVARGKYVENAYQTLGPLHDLAKDTIRQLYETQNLTQAMTTIHQMQRLYLVARLGLQDSEEIHQALADHQNFPLWHDFAILQADQEKKRSLAKALYNGDELNRKNIMLSASDYSREISEMVLQEALQDNASIDLWISDTPFQRRLLNCLDIEGAAKFGTLMAERYEHSERRIVTVSNFPSIPFADEKPARDIKDAYDEHFGNRFSQMATNQYFTGTLLPNPKEAEIENMAFQDYVDLYFNACAVDQKEIDRAHKILIAKLNAGSILRFTNSDGTDLTVDITDFTFENSLTQKNIPGFEVFSAPCKNSANGRVVAKGRFLAGDSDDIIEDIVVDFKDGRAIHYSAAVGNEYLKREIEKDEGSCYLGEIAFGTNYALTKHMVNGLLVEKIGRSFHFAFGNAYENTKNAIIDNGNRSRQHWDITVMLAGKDGMVTLDGEPIIQHGRYVDPQLAIFNGPQ